MLYRPLTLTMKSSKVIVESKGLLEICIDNYEDALIAIEGGADRLECCSRLDLDGLTPDVGLVRSIQAVSDLPLRIMIRPRDGDFCYEAHEALEMVSQIEAFQELGVEGFVLGCIDIFGDIDEAALELLCESIGDYGITFHRAFDQLSNQQVALDMLKAYGVDTVLTSGKEGKAINHLDRLYQINQWSKDDIHILVGGGVMPENATTILRKTGIIHLHASLNVASASYAATEKVQRLKRLIES